MKIVGFRVLSDERVGDGGFLRLRRLRLHIQRQDGSESREAQYDFVERPMGSDAVIVVLWHRDQAGAISLLLRHGLRVPIHFGREPGEATSLQFCELVAGIVEAGEDSEAGLRQRAIQEAHEEAGAIVDPKKVEFLGPALYPTPGMCAEKIFFLACELPSQELGAPPGDGSPFEEGATLEWLGLDAALARCRNGQICDMKTEVGIRRFVERF